MEEQVVGVKEDNVGSLKEEEEEEDCGEGEEQGLLVGSKVGLYTLRLVWI